MILEGGNELNLANCNVALSFMESYLSDRELIYETEDDPKIYNIKRCAPEDSLPSSLLWNIMCDEMFK